MKLRPQIAALIVLLVVMGFVLVWVGEAGVSTDVIKPTPTASPPPEPASVLGSADAWMDTGNDMLAYVADPTVSAQVVYAVSALDVMASQFGVDPIPEGASYPTLNLTQQIYEQVMTSVRDIALETAEGTSPSIQMLDGVPAALFRVAIPIQTSPVSGDYDGLDLAYAFVTGSNGDVAAFQYRLVGDPNDTIYADFLAWVAANAGDMVSLPGEAEGTTEATEPAEPGMAATEEAAAAQTAAPEMAATEEAPEALATPDAAMTEAAPEPQPAGTEEAALPVAPAETWMEVAPGQLLYAADPNVLAQLIYSVQSVDELVTMSGLEAPPADTDDPATDILNQFRTALGGQFTTLGLTVPEDAFTGPAPEEIGGVEVVVLRLAVGPQDRGAGQQPFPGVDLELALIPREDGNIVAVQFVVQGEPDEAVYQDYRTWLADNAEMLLSVEPTATPEPEATAEPEAAPLATVEATEPAE